MYAIPSPETLRMRSRFAGPIGELVDFENTAVLMPPWNLLSLLAVLSLDCRQSYFRCPRHFRLPALASLTVICILIY
jgi:hypothetical protein